MARSENNLTAVFTDTANAIREKTGDSALIIPRDFADAIANYSVATINGVKYNHCVTSFECNKTQQMDLRNKTLVALDTLPIAPRIYWGGVCYILQYKQAGNFINIYEINGDLIHDLGISDLGTLKNGFIVYKSEEKWALFYNLA